MKHLAQLLRLATLFVACIISAFAQGDRGTITGRVLDPAGAVVANAAVEAKNLSTGAVFPATSTSAGLYTLSQLPIGQYEVSVTVPGFKKYVRSGLTVEVAQTIGLDIRLEVGQASESVTVNAEATLLKTETSDVSHNVTVVALNTLPILGTGSAAAGSSGLRNPNNVTILVPGTFYQANSNVKVNGAPTNTQRTNVEGMDATNQLINFAPAETQPSVDAVQEVAVQTSNFAAEYGSVGGGLMNFTMRSGSNQYHGSVYDYVSNEALNAGVPYTDAGTSDSLKAGEHIRPRARRHDYGLTLGGPVTIPKLYDGKDKTFFFFNWEQFRETQNINNIFQTVPTQAYRNGDFSGAITALNNKVLTGNVPDPLGRTLLANEIFDPATRRTVNGQIVTDPFPGNIIPANRFDPVAVKVQANVPLPNQPGSFNNYLPSYPSQRISGIPGLKLDQQLGNRSKLSFYWSRTRTDSQYSPTFGNSEGFPDIITAARGTFIHSHVERLNYDYTVSPTALLHIGAGYQHLNFLDAAPITDFNAQAVYGLVGATVNRNTPNFGGFCPANACGAAGGLQNLGPANSGQVNQWQEKPSANASLTWVKANHTYKFGGDWFNVGIPVRQYANTNGNYTFDAAQTAQPYLVGQTLAGGSLGFAYASFLLGQVSQTNIAPFSSYRSGKINLGFFAQDSWKATRKMTVDYGLRWDYGSAQRETYGRFADFSGTAINPVLNRPGAFVFGGSDPGGCNCELAQNYKFGFGPRVGVAYNINSKTVFRSGFGVVYGQTNVLGLGAAATGTINSPGQGLPAMALASGIPSSLIPIWPNKIPNLYPATGIPAALPGGVGQLDQNAGRPSRQMQWSVGLQRQITPNFVVEGSYVANRGAWWGVAAPIGQAGMVNLNALTAQSLSAYGIDINNSNDLALLTKPLSDPAVAARGFGVPYAGFPTGQTLAQSLRPFPQLTTIPVFNAPVGKTWYDSLQVKATKRFSHGFNAQMVFTKQKSLQQGIESANGVFNNVLADPSNAKWLSSFDQPYTVAITGQYTVPRLDRGRSGGMRLVGYALSEWQVGTLLQYASGRPIPVPAATTTLSNILFQPTTMVRNDGVPLFNNDLNCHCYDIAKNFPLNAAAWSNPAAGQFGPTAGYLNDFRYQRRPSESINFGRTFQFTEGGRYKLNLRAEFQNMFNRAVINDPNVATSPLNPQTFNAAGATTGGFGFINRSITGTQFLQPRSGTIVARFTF